MTAKAQGMLEAMELGDWMIDQVYVTGETQFRIHVTAVPVFNGVAALRKPQLTAVRGDDAAANYYLTDVAFEFNAYGDLVDFQMHSPVDIKQIINDNVAVMSMEEMLEKARTYLQHSDYYDYGMPREILKGYEKNGTELGCTVDILGLEYNLTRIKVPDTECNYYYVPGITLKGDVYYYMKDTGEEYETIKDITLVTINGVDGTVVNEVNS